jgi:hypothetical protein
MRRAAPLAVALGLLAGAAPGPAPMRGVSWEGGREVAATALDPVRDLGADWISQTPFGWCASVNDPEIRFSGQRGYWGETDAGLVATASWARQRGLRTLLKPHLWVRRAWCGDIEMKSEADWRRFFDGYESFIVHYARLAEQNGMPALAVGTELTRTSRRTADWLRVIERVRSVYRGQLTYCANWQEAEDVGFWNALDFVGIQAYFPLPVRQVTPEALRTAWAPIVARLEALHARTRKRIVFTEVGYKSLVGSLDEPWLWETRGSADYALQRDAYEAMFASLWARPWFGGVFVWKWHPELGAPSSPPAGRERDFTPQGKPALEVIRSYYRRR